MLGSNSERTRQLLDFLKGPISALQDFYVLFGKSLRNLARRPHYWDDVLLQMDNIGDGSLWLTSLTGFFSGAVMALQMGHALAQYGQTGRTGQVVSIILVRELGPALTALMVAGRNSSGIASELGSMTVTEQIDAMRALGTDPYKKLVTPRVVSTIFMMFFLTIISDLVGLIGGWLISVALLGLDTFQYWNQAYQSLKFDDVVMGLSKPFVFGFIISTIGCYYGLSTRGGTQGVGRSTTQAVVASSVLIIAVDFFLTKFLMFWLS
jgi:phospholipid/cholesterol/gamma-HCH transport system permease protein